MKLNRIIQFFPLSSFVFTYRITNNWIYAFAIGGALSVAQIIYFIIKKYSFERFILAVNLFLLGGAIGLGFHISFIENLYEHFMYATLCIYLFGVGLFTTLFSKRGFINAQCVDTHHVRIYSFYLLAAVGVALLASYYFKNNFIFGASIPFLLLIIFRNELEKLCKSDKTKLI